MLTEKTSAPQFTLLNQKGEKVALKDFKGKWVLLYFYPKDDTPGCTTEACSLSEGLPDFKKLSCVILGVSADSVESHKKFSDKYKLKFDLLSDESKKVIEKYGVWVEKSMYGKKYMGIERASFLIDPKGKIAKAYPKVSPAKHTAEVMKDLALLA